MEELCDFGELVDRIRSRGASVALVGVDGAYGSGKSTLANLLAEALGGTVLEIDRYTRQNWEPYRQQLRYEDLQRDLEAMRSRGGLVVVEGICLLDVLERIGARLDLHLYVKKVNESGIWPDEDACDPEWIDLKGPMLTHPGAGVAREVASYHLERDPLGHAEVVFVRVDRG